LKYFICPARILTRRAVAFLLGTRKDSHAIGERQTMRKFDTTRLILAASFAGAVALIASCAPQATAPVGVSKPSPVASIPPRPYPPMGGPTGLAIPPLQADGKRVTVNSGLSSAQTVWNLRSAYNVAALNCQKPQHEAILPGYASFLKTHSKALKKVNSDLDRTFRAEHGSSKYLRAREALQTQIYNFFAFPPVLPALCDAVVSLSQDIASVTPGQLYGYAPGALAQLDGVYQQFYTSYAQYEADVAAWDARYGAGPAAAPGSVSGQSLAQ
jgi:hypothetical protein